MEESMVLVPTGSTSVSSWATRGPDDTIKAESATADDSTH